MRETFLPFSLPHLDETEFSAIRQVLESGWITTGPRTKEFEDAFAAAVGARHAVAVNSCTAAMHLALEAIGLRPGDEVITSPYTFAATAEVVRYFDARPVLVDIRAEDFNLDPDRIEGALTGRTRAIVPVHVGGLPAEMDAIEAVAAKHGLALIEDAAHAFPAEYRGRKIGSSGPVGGPAGLCVACFSFYATKPITTGEGGMLVTGDQVVADRCRVMALHGINHDAWKRYTAEGSWFYEIVAPGFKYNMTDVAAAMGLAQLHKAEAMWRRRCRIAHSFNAAFRELPQVQVPADRTDCQHAWHLYMLRLNLERLAVDRSAFVRELRRCNIGTSVHFIPLHLHPYYRQTYGLQPGDYPVANAEYQREISLPIYSRMSDQDVQDVIEAVQDVVRCHRLV